MPIKVRGAAYLGNKFADWCRTADLKPVKCDDGKVRSYRLHGLRKAACTQLAEAGCSAMEIMAVSGHVTLSEAQKYVDAVEQKKMAAAAMTKRAKNFGRHVTPETPATAITAIGSKPVQAGAPTIADGAPTASEKGRKH